MRKCGDCINNKYEECSKFGGKYPVESDLAEKCSEYDSKDVVVNDTVQEEVKEGDIEQLSGVLEGSKDIVEEPKKTYREFLKAYMKENGEMKGVGIAWKKYKNK